MDDLQDIRAGQIEQGQLWDELRVEHMWIHLVRGLVKDGEIARVGPVAFCVYVAIKAHTDLNTGNAWPSIALLAQQVGVSSDTVERALKKLIEAGLLRVKKQGRSNMYEVIEKIQMVTQDGAAWGSGQRKYVASQYKTFVDELKRLAHTGNLPGDRAITVNLTVNVQNITQGDHGNVTMNVRSVQVNSDDELKILLRKL
jgi:DNA-binding transcriptional regulator YhcF (GntR family)